jgi:hypothetical protein
MNWITLAVVGAIAAWFEYSYRKSRHSKTETQTEDLAGASGPPVPQHAQVASPASEPSIVPGDQDDKQMNAAV